MRRPPLDPAAFDDAGLIAAIPRASVTDCRTLAAEAGRRRLVSAVSSLEALCRRFKGFGLDHPVFEQTAAIDALAMLGAADALARIIADEAARLRARLPADVVIALLRHTEPAIRADVCRCADRYPPAIPMLIDLLGDLHRAVATEAAGALGRMGRAEARRSLTRLLREAPSADVIAAVASIADEECIVLLGRLAGSTSKLATDAREVLEGIDDPRAVTLLAANKERAGGWGARGSGRAELACKQQLLHGHQDSRLIFLLGRGPLEFIVEIKRGIRKLGPDLRVREPYELVLKLR